MHQFVTVHNAQHTSKNTGIVVEKVKVKSIFFLLPYLTTPQTMVGLGEPAIVVFFFKAMAMQKPERRQFSLQPVFLPQDGFVNLTSTFICKPDKFYTETNEMR